MDKIFKELFDVKEVRGVLLIASSGEVRYQRFGDSKPPALESVDWLSILNSLAGIREAELLCEKHRIYIRKAGDDCLVVSMGRSASPAMVRLNCDLLLPQLKESAGAKGLRRLFKR